MGSFLRVLAVPKCSARGFRCLRCCCRDVPWAAHLKLKLMVLRVKVLFWIYTKVTLLQSSCLMKRGALLWRAGGTLECARNHFQGQQGSEGQPCLDPHQLHRCSHPLSAPGFVRLSPKTSMPEGLCHFMGSSACRCSSPSTA